MADSGVLFDVPAPGHPRPGAGLQTFLEGEARTTTTAAGHESGGDHARPLLDVTVHGLPAPAGSKRMVPSGRPGGRMHLVESSKRVGPWREAVKYAALQAIADREGTGDFFAMLGQAVLVATTFTLPRPQSHYRTGRNAHLLRDTAPAFPVGKPDIEKLVRSTRDALTDAGVWTDDALVVRDTNEKVYAERGGTPGARIRIWAATP